MACLPNDCPISPKHQLNICNNELVCDKMQEINAFATAKYLGTTDL